MISAISGIILKKSTKTKIWWLKLFIGIILSNIFCFLLFSDDYSNSKQINISKIPGGWVEVQLEAQLSTPFQIGKKVLIVQRQARKKLEGVLQDSSTGNEGMITILVKEEEADALFQYQTWEILPYLKNLKFVSMTKERDHEIFY